MVLTFDNFNGFPINWKAKTIIRGLEGSYRTANNLRREVKKMSDAMDMLRLRIEALEALVKPAAKKPDKYDEKKTPDKGGDN